MRARRGREGRGGEGRHGEQERRRGGNENDKAGRGAKGGGNCRSQERMEREMLREDGRGEVCELQSAAKTRKVWGSQRRRDGNLERLEARQTTRVSGHDMMQRRK